MRSLEDEERLGLEELELEELVPFFDILIILLLKVW
jgi:hypothetical protein